MENCNWKSGVTFFKPASADFPADELAARAQREKIANHSFSLVMSNGPMPDEETRRLMQRYVDGELSLKQVLDKQKVMYGLTEQITVPANTDYKAA